MEDTFELQKIQLQRKKIQKLRDNKKKNFHVFNMTDGIYVSHLPVTYVEAEQIVTDFPARYKHQGYYLTSGRERIDPKSVQLKIVRTNENPWNNGNDLYQS